MMGIVVPETYNQIVSGIQLVFILQLFLELAVTEAACKNQYLRRTLM